MASLFVEDGSKLESTIDFSRFLKAAKKNWWKIIAFSVLTTGASIPLIQKLTPKYEAYATVLLKAELTNPTTFAKVVDFDSTRKEYYETQYQLLKSRRVMSQVVDDLKLYELPEFIGKKEVKDGSLARQKERSIKYLTKHLSISPVRKTQMVEVGFESTDPKIAASVANEIVDVFSHFSINDNHEASLNVSNLLAKQVTDLDTQLKQKEAKLNDFLKKEGLITFRGVDGFQTEQLSLLTDSLATATAQRANLEAIYKTTRDAKKLGINGLVGIPDVSRHPQMENLRQMIIEQRTELSNLEDRYGPKYEKVIQARSQLNILQAQASRLVNEITSGIKEQYQAAVLKENQLQAEVNKQANAFQLLGDKKTRYDNMMDDISQTRELYNELLKRQNQTQVSSQFSESSAKIIDQAIIPLKPTKPNKTLLIAVIAIMSLLTSTLFVIVMAAINNKVMSIAEVKRRLGLPVLGEVRAYSQQVTPKNIINNSSDLNTLDEASFGIRSQLLLQEDVAQVYVVTSATAQEGKSSIATLVAKALAVDSKVLLIDMDLRSSQLTQSLGCTEILGLTDLLSQQLSVKDAITHTQSIDFLSVGQEANQSPLITLTNKNLEKVFTELRQLYDFIIIDTPAVLDSKDAILTSKHADKVLFVTASNYNSSNICVSAIDLLKQYGSQVVGCVLNKVDTNLLESNENLQIAPSKDVLL
ncbi:GumC family protein [Photobacterium damselae]|uniref:GumC family protein n=1 Tax=Photobacterium damselae TaxID=38293 RepID=UPI0035A96E76